MNNIRQEMIEVHGEEFTDHLENELEEDKNTSLSNKIQDFIESLVSYNVTWYVAGVIDTLLIVFILWSMGVI